ncbi:uncharacterized protein LOC114534656 [Dendronephthya gigantea]|uniref:uncharacterized protein LOC114534656 n=1 Tax=Dendronephthya gigantea TaxID=151771 RepID=UPI00106C5CDA|nr:uncharacterized protein LOC114534656 [Dendronephthya gigantea]
MYLADVIERNQRGGGLCSYFNSNLNFTELTDLGDPEIESQWFLIKMDRLPRGINSIILGTVYHPPQSDDHALRTHIFKCLDSSLANYPNSAVLVLGDFNQFKPGNLCNSFRLKTLVTKPTRGSNVLDQAFSTLSAYYDATILPPIGQSDHSSILLQPTSPHAPSLPTTRLLMRDYRVSNKRNLISCLDSVNWTPLIRRNSCDDQLDLFQSVVHGALNSCIPMRTVKLHPNDKPWITPAIEESINKRQQAWLNNDLPKFNVYRNKVIKLCKSARRKFYYDKINHMHESNPKKWWDGIKPLSGMSNPPPFNSLAINGTVLRDFELATVINESFCSAAADIPHLNFTPVPVSNVPDRYVITRDAVELALAGVNDRKSVGPDEIPNWILKTCAANISYPVCSMFNSSIREGRVPDLWKCADVLPLSKIPTPKSIDTDLRPISLMAVLSKILESFVFNWLAPIVMPFIDPLQFGCVKKSSTTHALVHLIHHWLSALETPNTIIRSCFIDFSKAFDRIDHNILMRKLQLLNVPPVLLNGVQVSFKADNSALN